MPQGSRGQRGASHPATFRGHPAERLVLPGRSAGRPWHRPGAKPSRRAGARPPAWYASGGGRAANGARGTEEAPFPVRAFAGGGTVLSSGVTRKVPAPVRDGEDT
ncbi:hypothetical protein GCM10010145_13880 [Streptomyces ruber]|uniref:Uncharacterized protein n=2 Tax=Streptomyces TaxID=1883 RepID=A0A918EQW7_9ACTN|nr:hypothetical protein GCM10010145_13880 [Streptomyces ruber]